MKLVGHVSGYLNNGANAGLTIFNGNTSATNRNWNIGAHVRTCFAYNFISLPLGKINNKRSNWVSKG